MRISYVFEFLFGNRDKQLFLEVLSSACGHIRNKTIFSLLCSAAAYIGAKNISCEKVLYYIYPSSPQYPHASFYIFCNINNNNDNTSNNDKNERDKNNTRNMLHALYTLHNEEKRSQDKI